MNKEVILDVREDLNNKKDPLKKIMTTVKSLKKEELFILHSTIKPTPLLTVMKAKGYDNEVEKLGSTHYRTTFTIRKGGFFSSLFSKEKTTAKKETEDESLLKENEVKAYFLDNRGLQPPQPMVRTMKRLETLKSGETLTIHNDRVPVFLLEELKDFNIRYTIEEQSDGSAKVHLTKN
ncbi:uncharacterized protein (DUF2249 family) [Evansella vedderi]|uniref:Uncharacterized protein (DUF2249 family) n=1 Tax=Evansella vedderi TaxID=38282 RepID=A0ABT9ZW42_9BACI|nr:DUF2249 domain-containing protein [Evansella vedderi]MDQ0255439.1 uncharacterized protein (DUF2249 family) [Evansella vedderi]